MKPKTQSLHFVNGYAMPRDGSNGVDVRLADAFADAPARVDAEAYEPAFVKTNSLVLRFYVYFVERVENSQTETTRHRKCVLYYFLSDGSIKIIEPREANSGLTQGAFLRRHVVEGVTLRDLNVNTIVTVYGFTFHIYRCDEFTREYLERAGVGVPEDGAAPEDDAAARRGDASRVSRLPTRKKDARGKFLTHDKQVLRFYCVWDDASMHGNRRRFVLSYFLIDDTVAVTETPRVKGGRTGASTILLHRSRLPLRDEDACARGLANGDYDYVTAEDLRVGGVVRVYKRDFFIYDADAFTKSWYLQTYPSEYAEEDFIPRDVSEPEERAVAHRIPAHTGLAIGSEEDSLQNCVSLVPKPPRKDVACGEDVLQFRAEMVSIGDGDVVDEFDASRQFVVRFHVGDKTLSIFEQASKECASSKFLERARVKKPVDASSSEHSSSSSFYDVSDLRIGVTLEIHARGFKLTDTDEYTRRFLARA